MQKFYQTPEFGLCAGIIISTIFWVSLLVVSIERQETQFKNEAVNVGAAEYRVNKTGKVTFHWLTRKE